MIGYSPLFCTDHAYGEDSAKANVPPMSLSAGICATLGSGKLCPVPFYEYSYPSMEMRLNGAKEVIRFSIHRRRKRT